MQDPGLLNVLDFIFEHEFSEQEREREIKLNMLFYTRRFDKIAASENA